MRNCPVAVLSDDDIIFDSCAPNIRYVYARLNRYRHARLKNDDLKDSPGDSWTSIPNPCPVELPKYCP